MLVMVTESTANRTSQSASRRNFSRDQLNFLGACIVLFRYEAKTRANLMVGNKRSRREILWVAEKIARTFAKDPISHYDHRAAFFERVFVGQIGTSEEFFHRMRTNNLLPKVWRVLDRVIKIDPTHRIRVNDIIVEKLFSCDVTVLSEKVIQIMNQLKPRHQ